VLGGLQKLKEREPPLVALLARPTRTKESRFIMRILLSGEVATAPTGDGLQTRNDTQSALNLSGHEERIGGLESGMAELRNEVAASRRELNPCSTERDRA